MENKTLRKKLRKTGENEHMEYKTVRRNDEKQERMNTWNTRQKK